ncbi:permease-like cell division protein FtsX [Streptosporangium canum]|uniref:permease-like cell division protein FtsX n=1 Tax=Streptosporangium canum TaxID=324952 RepID=UPI00342DF867
MNSIEDRLRDAIAARAETVRDDDRPLPAPRARGASVRSPIRIAAVALAVAATTLGVVRLAAPSPGQQESIIATTMNGLPSGAPGVSVFLCKADDSFPSCKDGKITEVEKENLQRSLEARPEVETVVFEDQQQAWENFREQNKDDTEFLKDLVPGNMTESFRVRITAGADFSAVARAASELPGVSHSVDQACIWDNSPLGGSVKESSGWERCSFMGKGR